MLNKNNCILAVLAGANAAAIAVLSVGAYILHKKIMKQFLQELPQQQAADHATVDLNDGRYDRYGDDYSDYEIPDIDDELFEDIDTNGLESLNGINEGD